MDTLVPIWLHWNNDPQKPPSAHLVSGDPEVLGHNWIPCSRWEGNNKKGAVDFFQNRCYMLKKGRIKVNAPTNIHIMYQKKTYIQYIVDSNVRIKSFCFFFEVIITNLSSKNWWDAEWAPKIMGRNFHITCTQWGKLLGEKKDDFQTKTIVGGWTNPFENMLVKLDHLPG